MTISLTPALPLARPTDPASSQNTAITIARRKQDQSARYVHQTLETYGPLTLDELTARCEARWPGQYTPQRYRTASKQLRRTGHVTIVGKVARPGKASRVILLDTVREQAA